jgi:hypothetical protein
VTGALLLLLLSADDCARCHAQVATDFASSRHARARRHPVFALSFVVAQTRWCLTCHQPEGRGDGHTCLTCHRGAGGSLASAHVTDAGASAHPVTVVPGFETERCARCHEFTTPLPGHLDPVVLSDQPLQSTVSEQRAAMPGATCVTCHDPHRAPGAHDPALLARALTATASRVDGGVAIELTVGRTGHRFPTGDPFRRLVVATCADEACTEVAGRRVFSRSLGSLDGGAWTTVRDTTLSANQRTAITLPDAAWWSVRYFFGDPRFEAQLPQEEVFVMLGGGPLR